VAGVVVGVGAGVGAAAPDCLPPWRFVWLLALGFWVAGCWAGVLPVPGVVAAGLGAGLAAGLAACCWC